MRAGSEWVGLMDAVNGGSWLGCWAAGAPEREGGLSVDPSALIGAFPLSACHALRRAAPCCRQLLMLSFAGMGVSMLAMAAGLALPALSGEAVGGPERASE